MAEIFISHIHEDERVASALNWVLRDKLKITAFLSSDVWQLRAGEEWLTRIREELLGCKVMVSLLTPESVRRPWINFEAGAAWFAQKPVIPACFGGLSKGLMPQPFASLQGVDLPADTHNLFIAVSRHLSWLPPLPYVPGDPLMQSFEGVFRGEPFLPPLPPPPMARR